MCIIFIAINQHPLFKVIIAGNRDEFIGRPAARLSRLTPQSFESNASSSSTSTTTTTTTTTATTTTATPVIIAGRDLEAGGTWMGVNESTGAFAALTNARSSSSNDVPHDELSRGILVANFLTKEVG